MAEYINRQAAIEAIENTPVKSIDAEKGLLILSGLEKACDIIEAMPAADVVPVVRCKKCKHFMPPHACLHDDGMITARSDGFCSYGERSEKA